MLNLLKESDFDSVYEIMEQSFPENERRRFEKQKAFLLKDCYKIYTINEGKKIKAFIAVYGFEDFLFAEHFAVAREYRNHGLGSLILQELIKTTPKQICLEVERPETELAKRRIEFYKRNGFYLNSYDYIQPSIDEGRLPLPLLIMSTRAPLTESEFCRLKELVYKEVYNQ